MSNNLKLKQTIIIAVLAILFEWVLIYFCFSFIELSINPSYWSRENRTFFVFLYALFTIFTVIIAFGEIKDSTT
jgi:hypothetical protein